VNQTAWAAAAITRAMSRVFSVDVRAKSSSRDTAPATYRVRTSAPVANACSTVSTAIGASQAATEPSIARARTSQSAQGGTSAGPREKKCRTPASVTIGHCRAQTAATGTA
jgi:hypothetical protein